MQAFYSGSINELYVLATPDDSRHTAPTWVRLTKNTLSLSY